MSNYLFHIEALSLFSSKTNNSDRILFVAILLSGNENRLLPPKGGRLVTMDPGHIESLVITKFLVLKA